MEMTAKVPVTQTNAMSRLNFMPDQLCVRGHSFRLEAAAVVDAGQAGLGTAFILALDI